MIGIGIGAMNTSVAHSESGSQSSRFLCDVVLSETSARTIPSVIGYSKSHRMIGEHAMITIRKHINSTFIYLNRLIGMKADTEYCKREMEHLLTDLTFEANENSELVYRIPLKLNENHVKDNLSASPEYILSESMYAAFINKIKLDLVLATHKKECFAFTLAVPDFYTLNQREAVSRSLKICELETFNIINESTAITLYYGYNRYKSLFVEDDPKRISQGITGINPSFTRYIIFIDFGHSKTSLIFSELKPTMFRVANVQTDPFLGGREMDRLIFLEMCKIFRAKYKIDISDVKKSAIRLMEQITKARKILTANKETMINIDCLYEDYDFSYLLTRKEFESIIKPVVDSFATMFGTFYKTCLNVIDKQIYSVEMAGECMRTPIFQQIVKDITGKDLQKSIIVDEAVSKGAAMYTALMYGALPLQSFNGIYHFNPYTLIYDINESGSFTVLANRGEPVPNTKVIDLYSEVLENAPNGIVKVVFAYLKQETEMLIGGENIILELNIDLGELFKVNKQECKNCSHFQLEVLVDNYSKVRLQSIKPAGNQSAAPLKLNVDIMCFNKREVFTYINTLILPYPVETAIINDCRKIEKAHFQQDEYVKALHLKKNQLESNVYKLKNKYMEKEGEYEKLASNVSEPRSLLARLNSVEEHIVGEGGDFIDHSRLETADQKLKEVEKIMGVRKASTDNTSGNVNPSSTGKSNVSPTSKMGKDQGFYQMNEKLNHYSNLLDTEYIKLLEGKKSRLDEKTINLISEILSKYRLLIDNASSTKDYELYLGNLDREMKKYFK